MTLLNERPPKFGQPRVTMHLEAHTDDCICHRLPGCGGIVMVDFDCSEHGVNAGPEGVFHTHAVQVSKVSRGRRYPGE